MNNNIAPAELLTDNPTGLAKSREANYAFFAGIFRNELTEKQVMAIQHEGILSRLTGLFTDMDTSLFERPVDEIVETLSVEYAYLFIGPGPHISPYESVHVKDEGGRDGLLWGSAAVDFKTWVEHYGLSFSSRFESIPDHFCAILEFMANVISEEINAGRSGHQELAVRCRQVESEFFHKHIGNWMPGFFKDVATRARQPFYRCMARLAGDFIEIEKEMVGKGAGY